MASDKDFAPITPACLRALTDKIYEKRFANHHKLLVDPSSEQLISNFHDWKADTEFGSFFLFIQNCF